ncbi:MAG: M48 family metallopeptidase [Blastocatellia bacterium]|nr:M48 family metallopeptidase [Blastocatellia bacterium]
MYDKLRQPIIASLIALSILTVGLSPAMARPLPRDGSIEYDQKKEKDKDKKKDKKKDNDKDDKLSKQENMYLKIEQFSKDEYEKDPAFRAEVEAVYLQKQREHSEYAYYINTRDADDTSVTRTGDKLRVEDTFYDNPLVQDYVNRVGHSLVPRDSKHFYAFKVTLNPIAEARSLSTGTVYVSTGLISSIDNEAQLAYVLAHEIAHVEKGHWFEDVLMGQGLERYNQKQEDKRKNLGAIGNLAAGPLARLMGANPFDALLISNYVQSGLPMLLKLALPNAVFSWEKRQEDEADHLALKYMFERNYDPREAPRFYANLRRASQLDRRAELGFMASASRITERLDKVNSEMGGLPTSTAQLQIGAINLSTQLQARRAYEASTRPRTATQPDTGKRLDPSQDTDGRIAVTESAVIAQSAAIEAKINAGEIIGSTAEFMAVMSQLKRDNGIRAYYYDMFQMSRDNLEESLNIRSNDPLAHYYYGKILKLTARTLTEKNLALTHFVRAIALDRRRVLPEARLHRALAIMEAKNFSETREIINMLKEYVEVYRLEHKGELPPNMDVIYDYFQEVGENTWVARPVSNVSEKVEPISDSSPPRQPAAAQPPARTEPPAVKPKTNSKKKRRP